MSNERQHIMAAAEINFKKNKQDLNAKFLCIDNILDEVKLAARVLRECKGKRNKIIIAEIAKNVYELALKQAREMIKTHAKLLDFARADNKNSRINDALFADLIDDLLANREKESVIKRKILEFNKVEISGEIRSFSLKYTQQAAKTAAKELNIISNSSIKIEDVTVNLLVYCVSSTDEVREKLKQLFDPCFIE